MKFRLFMPQIPCNEQPPGILASSLSYVGASGRSAQARDGIRGGLGGGLGEIISGTAVRAALGAPGTLAQARRQVYNTPCCLLPDMT